MTLFPEQEVQLFNPQRAQRVENRYRQLPSVVPLVVEPEQYFLIRKETDYVPIVAIVGIVGLLAFLGFLAFLHKG